MADLRQAMDMTVRGVTQLLGGGAGVVAIALLLCLLIVREGARAAADDVARGPLLSRSVGVVTWALVLVAAVVVEVRLRQAIAG